MSDVDAFLRVRVPEGMDQSDVVRAFADAITELHSASAEIERLRAENQILSRALMPFTVADAMAMDKADRERSAEIERLLDNLRTIAEGDMDADECAALFRGVQSALAAERDAEIAGLRDGLVRIIDAWDGDGESMHDDPAVIARATLAGDKQIADDYIERAARISAACQAALRALDTYAAMYRGHMTVQLYSARAGLRDALGRGS